MSDTLRIGPDACVRETVNGDEISHGDVWSVRSKNPELFARLTSAHFAARIGQSPELRSALAEFLQTADKEPLTPALSPSDGAREKN